MVIDELDKIMRVLCEGLMGLMVSLLTQYLKFRALVVPGAYMACRDAHTDELGTQHTVEVSSNVS
jgi:hypothetical protein